jgi:hypothetical protein
MKRLLTFVLFLGMPLPSQAEGTGDGARRGIEALNPARTREAIAFGQHAEEAELRQYELRRERGWWANFDTPYLRVAQLARSARKENPNLSPADIGPEVSAEVAHVYAHARQEGSRHTAPPPNFDYIMIVRPGKGGPGETVLPLAIQSYVRRVPVSKDFEGPTQIARSVKAAFPLAALVPGAVLKIVFEGGSTESVPFTAEMIAKAR